MKLILKISLCFYFTIPTTFAADIFTCPKIKLPNGMHQSATSIALFSGHPSEMAMLKPDNADTDDTSPEYWRLGESPYPIWYVCNYQRNEKQREFKLPKTYTVCSNIGKPQLKSKLECK
ncbi:MAG: STY0301 family protein [Methylophilus sp.]|nr:STY0301 family protein [Methylophilus sp.]